MKTLTATTRNGQKLIIAPIFTESSPHCEYKIIYEANQVKLSNTNFRIKEGKFCVVLNSWMVKKLLAIELPKDTEAAIVVDQNNAEDIIRNQWVRENKRLQSETCKREIESMLDNDIITLYAYSGMGMHYSIENEKMGYNTSQRAAHFVKEILDESTTQPAPEKNSDVAYKVIMTWGEYQKIVKEKNDKINAKSEKEKAEREAIFAKAKETGKKQILFSEFLHGEDIPKKYREEDSDMGTHTAYVEPDGSISHSFVHAY